MVPNTSSLRIQRPDGQSASPPDGQSLARRLRRCFAPISKFPMMVPSNPKWVMKTASVNPKLLSQCTATPNLASGPSHKRFKSRMIEYLPLVSLILLKGIFIWIAVTLAVSRNRDPVVWGLFAVLFSILAIIILAFLSNLPKEETQETEPYQGENAAFQAGKYANKSAKKIWEGASYLAASTNDGIANRSKNPLFILLVGAALLSAFYWFASPYHRCIRQGGSDLFCTTQTGW